MSLLKKNRLRLALFFIIFNMFISGIQLFLNRRLLVMLITGMVLVYLSLQFRKKWRFLRNTGLFIGILMIILAALSTVGVWISSFIVTIVVLIWGTSFLSGHLWKENAENKTYISVQLKDPSYRYYNERYNWLGTQRIGQKTFEWDDINISQFGGDTIIDLGNTLLPNQENVVMIRKGVGRVRILVPYGVGIMLHHNAFFGKVTFHDDLFELKNETVKLYSDNYKNSVKKIKIISTIVVGTVEVIEV